MPAPGHRRLETHQRQHRELGVGAGHVARHLPVDLELAAIGGGGGECPDLGLRYALARSRRAEGDAKGLDPGARVLHALGDQRHLGAAIEPGEGEQFHAVGDRADRAGEIMGDARADQRHEVGRAGRGRVVGAVGHRRFPGTGGRT